MSVFASTDSVVALTTLSYAKFTGDSQLLVQEKITDKEILGQIALWINSSKKTSRKASSTTEIMRLTVLLENKIKQEYVLSTYGDSLYIQNGDKLRLVDRGKLVEFLQLGQYRYSQLPTATIQSSGQALELQVYQSSFEYSDVDGDFTMVRDFPAYYQATTVNADNKGIKVLRTLSFNGTGIASVEIQGEPVKITTRVSKGEVEFFRGTQQQAESFVPKNSGTYLVEVTAKFDNAYCKGDIVYAYHIAYDNQIQFTIENNSTYQGELILLRAKNIPKDGKITVKSDLDFTPQFFDSASGEKVALLPLSLFSKLGVHKITLSSGEASKTFNITANYKKFQTMNLNVSAATSQQTINSNAANEEYRKKINPLKTVADPKVYWDGRFIFPVKAQNRITTSFGTIQYINGSQNSSVHGAVDIAAPTGTPVFAVNGGKVLYSGLLKLTGNTVLIEHGLGLKSWYYHMDTLAVSTGDIVEKAQQVGTIGTTGFSTGPHLHFQMTVNNLSINPYTLMDTDILDGF